MAKPKVTIILPALNEEKAIGKVIDEIPKSALEKAGYIVQVLVADGNSTDQTRKIAERKGADIIIEPRRGKGVAIKTALKTVDADYIFMIDADYTYPASYIPDMLTLLQEYSVVMGSRIRGKRERGAMTRINTIGNHLLSLLATILYQKRVSDVCTGYWGFQSGVLKGLDVKATGFELEARLFSRLARKGYSIAEIPVNYRKREGQPKLNPLKDGSRIAWTLIKRRFQKITDEI
ncbi:MAG: glycosyltransferase [Desulfobacteraceae bacterium]|nr:glycosyltransferase [Desulfobacteraceae bacterium]